MVASTLVRQGMQQYEPVTAIAVCLALCEVELNMLKTDYGRDFFFDAFTMIQEPMKDDEIDSYGDADVAQLAREALQLFRCMNDWLAILRVSPVSPADIEEKSHTLDELKKRFRNLST